MLGDYTEDDDNASQHKKPKRDPPSDAGFRCPVCCRVLKTIAGFRGHVTKQHNQPHLKAHQHRVTNTAENPIIKTTSTDVQSSITDIFPGTFDSTLKSIAKDPIHKLLSESEITSLCSVVLCLSGVHQFFLDTFVSIFSVGRTLCSTMDRECMFQKFHQISVSSDFTRGYMLLLGTLTFTNQGICNFVNILMMELMGNLIKEQVKLARKKAALEHESISDLYMSLILPTDLWRMSTAL